MGWTALLPIQQAESLQEEERSMTIETLAVDIAKNVFQLHGANRDGRAALKRRVMRDQFHSVVAQIDPWTVILEACNGALAVPVRSARPSREDHQPAAQKALRATPKKHHGNGAQAICTAAGQPHIPFVPKKTFEQQDIQALRRARQRMVNYRTAVVSQIRGLLLDRGIAMAKIITCARRLIPNVLSNMSNELTPMARSAIAELHDRFRDLDRRIAVFDKKTIEVFRNSEPCQRIAGIKGVEP
jgi:transposase